MLESLSRLVYARGRDLAASRGIRTFPARTNPMPRPALIASSTASPWEPADKRAQQRELKRNAVLQTAAQLFNERGFHATSLDDIAERLNVSKPTVYYYVESKDQILLECVKIALDLMQAGIDEVAAYHAELQERRRQGQVGGGHPLHFDMQVDPRLARKPVSGNPQPQLVKPSRTMWRPGLGGKPGYNP